MTDTNASGRNVGPRIRDFDAIDSIAVGCVLTFVAGCVDAIGLAILGQSTSHMSGTTSLLVHDAVVRESHLAVLGSVAIVAFVSGALASGLLLQAQAKCSTNWKLSALLLVEAAVLLIAVGISFASAATGVLTLAPLAAFAMGLQNSTGSALLQNRLRTTHVTGILTDMGAAMGRLLSGGVKRRRTIDTVAFRRAVKLLTGFAAGGVIGIEAIPMIGPASLLIPVFALLIGSIGVRLIR